MPATDLKKNNKIETKIVLRMTDKNLYLTDKYQVLKICYPKLNSVKLATV